MDLLLGMLGLQFSFSTLCSVFTIWRIGSLKYLETEIKKRPSRAKRSQTEPGGAWLKIDFKSILSLLLNLRPLLAMKGAHN